jgi:hypothetical protein
VPDGEAARDHVVAEEERALHPERLEDERADSLLVRAAGELLDHASRDVEGRVVVRPHLAERRLLSEPAESSDHPGERIVPRSEVGEVVADPPGRVREEVAHRRALRGRLVAHAQLG